MSGSKWGESFLKSGLPLEHLTQVTMRSLDWYCQTPLQYSRLNREKQEVWFELDLYATAPKINKSTELAILVECKYHDLSRYWFFLPHQSSGRWEFDDRVLNCGPYQTLRKPRVNTLLPLAPMSTGGIVVSQDGTKQDNAVHTAVQQLVNGFLPCCLDQMFMYNIDFTNTVDPSYELQFTPDVTALVPMIVTNATLYRLRSDVTDLDAIRNASAPIDVADEVPWTWYYHDTPVQMWDQNSNTIKIHKNRYRELVYRFPGVEDSLHQFVNRPNWIAVVNIKDLARVAARLFEHFLKLGTRDVATFLRPPRPRRRKVRGKG